MILHKKFGHLLYIVFNIININIISRSSNQLWQLNNVYVHRQFQNMGVTYHA